MTDLELEETRLKLQKYGLYISLAGLLLGLATLYYNTRSTSSAKK